MIDENAAPTPKPNVDIISLSPSSEQYFLFSRVDGKLTVAQLCQTSGLGRETTLECLRFLAAAGAVDIPGYQSSTPVEPPPAQPARAEGAAAKTAGATEPRAERDSVRPNYPIPPEDFEFDAALLAMETPLDDALRRELICLHEQLDKMSYYDLFGLSVGASKKEIKRAYFRLSKRHHPDNFFRQDLGRLGQMQETVFKEIARAYTTLSKKRTRKAYDAALQAHLAEHAPAHDAPPQPTQQEDVRERNKRKAVGTLLVRRAEKLEERGDFAQAAEEYRKALALTRDPQLALRVAARMLNPASLPKEAASFARAALKLGAPVASARFVLGCAMQAVGARSQAIQEFQKVVEASPEHSGARARLVELEQL